MHTPGDFPDYVRTDSKIYEILTAALLRYTRHFHGQNKYAELQFNRPSSILLAFVNII